MTADDRPRSELELLTALGLTHALPANAFRPAQRRCDFCELPAVDRPPRWYYPTSSVVRIGLFEMDLGDLAGGGWLACELCHPFIERQDYEGLAVHSGYPVAPDGGLPSGHAIFRDIRLGPGQPYQEG